MHLGTKHLDDREDFLHRDTEGDTSACVTCVSDSQLTAMTGIAMTVMTVRKAFENLFKNEQFVG